MAINLAHSLTIEDLIGNGGFADVYLASADNGRQYAIKSIAKEIVQLDSIARELQAGELLHHPNVVKFSTYFHDEENHYLAFDYIPGDL